ncbi:MAG: hypothetical protein AAF959_05175 [Cyanobacteria bacterium P01_D01_bin.56]
MTNFVRTVILLGFLSVLWVLTRMLQAVFEIAELSREADYISGSELELQVKIRRLAGVIASKFIKA